MENGPKLIIFAVFAVSAAACHFLPEPNRTPNSEPQISFLNHAQTLRKIDRAAPLGDFERANILETKSLKAEMKKDGADFLMIIETAGQKTVHRIEAVVGRKKLEQYVARENDRMILLPIAYDLDEKRWKTVSETFFEPDGADFRRHQKDWNTACANCHLEQIPPESASFKFENLDSETSLLVCGSCHAKGLTDSLPKIEDAFSKSRYSNESVTAHQTAPQNPAHFFENGGVRLAAHEYQGLIRSVCFVKSKSGAGALGGEKINCLSCHTLENGSFDVKNDRRIRSFQACTNCHQQFNTPTAIGEHTKHPADSAASSCYACHMPEIAYGHLRFQRTHEISVPNPELTRTKNVPNACNLCHLDKPVNWTIRQGQKLWPTHFRQMTISEDSQFDEPEALRSLLTGDAFTRALTADALRNNSANGFVADFSDQVLQAEKYPLVRYFLEKSSSDRDFQNSGKHSTLYAKPLIKGRLTDIIISE